MSHNISVSQRTKHDDVRFRFRFVNLYVMEGFIKVILVKTDENDVDFFTKNLSVDKYNKHSDKLISNKGVQDREFARLICAKHTVMAS